MDQLVDEDGSRRKETGAGILERKLVVGSGEICNEHSCLVAE